jgi:ADP-ribosylglycohydrolase
VIRPDALRGAWIGLALGDAFGAPVEFDRAPSLSGRLPSSLRWTDDSHMSVYLARALRSGVRDVRAFADVWGDEIVAWSRDPGIAGTAPGATCLRGARALEAGGDPWSTGDTISDGCGAVMRILPIAATFAESFPAVRPAWAPPGAV